MFAFLRRRKVASDAAALEADAATLSANARQKRVFDRTIMSPNILVPEVTLPPARDSFGLKHPAE